MLHLTKIFLLVYLREETKYLTVCVVLNQYLKRNSNILLIVSKKLLILKNYISPYHIQTFEFCIFYTGYIKLWYTHRESLRIFRPNFETYHKRKLVGRCGRSLSQYTSQICLRNIKEEN